MASSYGKNLKVSILGTSHGPEILVEIKGVPVGTVIDYSELSDFMIRRSSGYESLTTERHEPDDVEWRKGIVNFGTGIGIVTEEEIVAAVENKDVDSSAYEQFKYIPRPGHADFAAMMKDGLDTDLAGGGRFSGRLTVGLCIAGGIIKQLLLKDGITIDSQIIEIAGDDNEIDFEDVIGSAKAMKNSVGGIIECAVMGLKPGSIGDSYFNGIESRISEAVFGIPAVKGIEFGAGFKGTKMLGSDNNDEFVIDEDGKVITETNNHGGILGGIASGMPITLRAAIKPTPSIGVKQKSVNLKTMEPVEIEIEGRHDACIVPRALPCVESAVAIAIYDMLLESNSKDEKKTGSEKLSNKEKENIDSLRNVIDEQNDIILNAFKKRMEAAKEIGKLKREDGKDILDKARESEILSKVISQVPSELKESTNELFTKIMELGRAIQEESIGKKNVEVDEGKFGLLGKSISESYSPEIHEKISKIVNKEYDYVLFEKKEDELEDFIKNGKWAGLNVTMPYKEEVIKYLDELSSEAELLGAVNTIVRRNGKLKGFNTDYFGFKHMLEKNGVEAGGKKCLVLGAGGASKAVRQVLLDKGANVSVLSHKAIDEKKAIKENKDAEIIVNTTPVGMTPDNGNSLVFPGSFPKLKWALDIVYNPFRTNLLCQAKKSDINYAGGFDMLVYQAIYSSMLFTTLKYDNRDEMAEKIINEIKNDKQNIILIGMPGVGKSTIGRKFSEKLGWDFYDTDNIIELDSGKTIQEIFDMEGEESFRELETLACQNLSKLSHVIIATGGGVVTREENYYLLAENGNIIFLNRDITNLPTEGRPISKAMPIERIYKNRLPEYKSWADLEIDIENKTEDEIIKEIMSC